MVYMGQKEIGEILHVIVQAFSLIKSAFCAMFSDQEVL